MPSNNAGFGNFVPKEKDGDMKHLYDKLEDLKNRVIEVETDLQMVKYCLVNRFPKERKIRNEQ